MDAFRKNATIEANTTDQRLYEVTAGQYRGSYVTIQKLQGSRTKVRATDVFNGFGFDVLHERVAPVWPSMDEQREMRAHSEEERAAKVAALRLEHARERVDTNAARLKDELNSVIGGLRRMADDIENDMIREVAGCAEHGVEVPWAGIVQRAQHTAIWGHANLGLDTLTSRLMDLLQAQVRLALLEPKAEG